MDFYSNINCLQVQMGLVFISKFGVRIFGYKVDSSINLSNNNILQIQVYAGKVWMISVRFKGENEEKHARCEVCRGSA